MHTNLNFYKHLWSHTTLCCSVSKDPNKIPLQVTEGDTNYIMKFLFLITQNTVNRTVSFSPKTNT